MSKNLKLRIIFGLLYAVAILGMLYKGNGTGIILLAVFGLLMTWEYIDNTLKSEDKLMQGILTFVNVPLVLAVSSQLTRIRDLYPLIIIYMAYAIGNMYLLFIKKRVLITNKPYWFHMIMYITLPILMAIICCLQIEGFSMSILYLFFVVWLCDVGAYFVGKAWGDKKMFPAISPNKTWAGFYGGLSAGVLTAVALFYITGLYSIWIWVILGIVICITSIIGDLIESSFKRHHGIKDSSNFIPGHGGFLDRLDSFIFALPFYIAIITIFAL